jgi:virginiamycin A acetyltransferase
MNSSVATANHDIAPFRAEGLSFACKKSMIMSGAALPCLELASQDLKEVEVNPRDKHLGSVRFERGAGLSSPVVANAKSVFVGAYSYMNDSGYIRDRVMIGRYCSIGRRVTIGAGFHDIRGLSSSPFLRGKRKVERAYQFTMIWHDVWIGDGVIIMPGVQIGVGAVVGANAVVTHDVEDYSIVAGVPARKIGMRFEPVTAQRLLRSAFWELPRDILKGLPVDDVPDLLDQLEADASKFERIRFETYRLSKLETI